MAMVEMSFTHPAWARFSALAATSPTTPPRARRLAHQRSLATSWVALRVISVVSVVAAAEEGASHSCEEYSTLGFCTSSPAIMQNRCPGHCAPSEARAEVAEASLAELTHCGEGKATQAATERALELARATETFREQDNHQRQRVEAAVQRSNEAEKRLHNCKKEIEFVRKKALSVLAADHETNLQDLRERLAEQHRVQFAKAARLWDKRSWQLEERYRVFEERALAAEAKVANFRSGHANKLMERLVDELVEEAAAAERTRSLVEAAQRHQAQEAIEREERLREDVASLESQISSATLKLKESATRQAKLSQAVAEMKARASEAEMATAMPTPPAVVIFDSTSQACKVMPWGENTSHGSSICS
mmetsp:Transcript_56655/g.121984  ORF Transcript_56655/g.121984 Transcript_56655/m.121984 type:complete len:364 (+) Transcript_56655:115-1206(+)